ncbi:MAG: hypothetical protein C4288_13055 [Leptolyngbya sp. ERB_1_1]
MKLLPKKLLRLPFVLVRRFYGKLLSILFAPNQLLSLTDDIEVKLHSISLDEASYTVAEVPHGRIFTNRIDNISITVDRKLVPLVSWQYFDGDVMSDEENFFLLKKTLPLHIPHKVQGGVVSLLTGGGGNYNYYHWLFDSLPRLELINRVVAGKVKIKYYVPENTHEFQKETLAMLGIEAESVISSKDFPYLSADYCFASSHPNNNADQVPSWVLNFLQKTFLKHTSNTTFSPFVYIERGDSVNARRLLNESEFYHALKPLGFQSYRLADLSVKDQITLFANARMIVGVHGAGFANLAFAAKETVIYELFAKSYVPLMYRSISAQLQFNYQSICCEDFEKDVVPQRACFKLSSSEIEQIKKHAEQVAKNTSELAH